MSIKKTRPWDHGAAFFLGLKTSRQEVGLALTGNVNYFGYIKMYLNYTQDT